MKIGTHVFIQLLGTMAQFANLDLSAYNHTVQIVVALVVALAQASVAWYAHNFNTDGTPQSVAKP